MDKEQLKEREKDLDKVVWFAKHSFRWLEDSKFAFFWDNEDRNKELVLGHYNEANEDFILFGNFEPEILTEIKNWLDKEMSEFREQYNKEF